jgi:hypothetical protein
MLDWIKKKHNSKRIKKQEQNTRSVFGSIHKKNEVGMFELIAGTTIYPGMFLSMYAAETENKTIQHFVKPITTNKKLRDILIAVENPYCVGADINRSYEKNQLMLGFVLRPLNTVLTKISSLQGTTLDRETELCHDEHGFLREVTESEKDLIIARSLDIDIRPTLPRWTEVEIL